ncbi:MAG: NADPH-dependent FMN reductase [Aurantimonas coralicida]|uniref:Putative NAD(P)H dependent FMN reductase n=1 Tax=Aurantimonas manganoxydans (strain ATCC BAA-1229 / DSM 21871 / SI85-9A1) TaxID=287752 RepID=Q1YES8_AURMS|nr:MULTISPECIES: NADPH-dependent FMN reductase [Aurantimonas]EAS48817.1 putative NAD(P)H dependent FMN reductase [Aurantimonas manganoxydans SI85-9A1]MBC6715524.1 NAD(P)H-dependent oxidoreductase [Aurantimonas sp. DM33-3]MCW7544530.1 NAD(P)H-dependent oxidoreductase [Aurantimonas litoralis]MDE0921839.1 NAD(P)H-dependent oxidoreductase [Aurantimonas coralicida]
MSANILVLPGSLRLASHNRKLAAEATRMLALSDAVVTRLDLADYPLPLYDGDHEQDNGIPENAVLLAHRIAVQDGLLLVSPEYNHSIPAVLKNAIDWASRVRKVQGRPVQPFKGLVVGLASASPGRFGGARGLEALRLVMRALGAEVLTQQCSVADAANGFDENGRLSDDIARTSLESLVDKLLDTSRSLSRRG